ncbi:hypothetical protein ACOME3_008070 [Neoechinorhynchus agilis]
MSCCTFMFDNGEAQNRRLQYLLSFALGSLLTNTFIHILPECWDASKKCHLHFNTQGSLIIVGIILFIGIEKIFNGWNSGINSTGYLNLIANVFDNFVHGLSVGTAFLISRKVGALTVLSIVVHEIPHEFSDFLILLNSGFTPKYAAIAQLRTSTSSMVGAAVALCICQTGLLSALVLLITGGAFIHVSLIGIVPQLRNEYDYRESLKNISMTVFGICFIYLLTKSGIM